MTVVIKKDKEPEEPEEPEELFVVRLFDGMDNQWMDVSEAVTKEEARRIWLEKTDDGTKRTCFDDIDYYDVFPANTRMMYSDGFGEH